MNLFEQLLPLDARFELVHQELTDTHMYFYLRSNASSAHCPRCQEISTRRHSHTKRKVRDLPIAEKEVFLYLLLRKWFCSNELCPTKIFTETVDAAPAHHRNTTRVTAQLLHIAFQSSCVQGAKLSAKLHIPVSHDTLLRLIHQTPMITEFSPFPRHR